MLLTAVSLGHPDLPLISIKSLRVAADEPYTRRTLWEMCPPHGTFMYQPRIFDPGWDEREFAASSRVHGWPRIPDTQFPEPWSCDWTQYPHCGDWYDSFGPQETVESMHPRDLVGLVPAMFVPPGPDLGDTVLCPPGGAGTYYLWWNDRRASEQAPWEGDMQRFVGVYASLEHFVRTADWNRLEG
ncbi:hypothetical protein FB451DRAFT_1403124 [Mycena latifolia]|nr:hypothetical protein FB451DRAFT_1403124 [Mycena latifolia]